MAERGYDKFRAILAELFMLDQAELDFGIYRIMNTRREEIWRFLDNELLPQVKAALGQVAASDRASIETELEQTVAQLRQLGSEPEQSTKVHELRAKLAQSASSDEAENEVYNHLATFFRRYYKEGDFISQRRYREGVYAIPYEGEEVKLYWANHDQYYVKSAEQFRDYTFVLPDNRRVQFKLVEADTEANNNRARAGEERRFRLADGDAVSEEDGELVIRMAYEAAPERERQADINQATAAAVMNAPAAREWAGALGWASRQGPDAPSVLEKHLRTYTAKNSFDYFIHKDLGTFLRRELDFYLKSEVMHLDDIDGDGSTAASVESYLAKLRAIRAVGHKIIAFLAQLEDFQKKLWLKKKFVVETTWCVTLDRVPEALYAEIAANEAQREEWVRLFAIDEIDGDMVTPGYSQPLTVGFLKANQFLPVDTRFFGSEFTETLLASFEDLDDATDGLLIHSENFQALNLLQERYREQVQCIYIDPPYNSDAAPILYKNGYKSSSWVSLLESRLAKAKGLLPENGILVAAIDDEQHRELDFLLADAFEGHKLGTICVRANPSGRPTQTGYSVSHEYLLYAGREGSAIGRMPPTPAQRARFSQTDAEGAFEWRNLRREGSNSDRAARPALYYPIYLAGDRLRVPAMEWESGSKSWRVQEQPNSHEKVVWPDNESGDQKTWRWEWSTVMASLGQLAVRPDRSGRDYVYCKRRPNDEGVVSVSSWFDAKYSATEHGTALIKDLFGGNAFSYPKSIHAVVDAIYVAGASKHRAKVLDFFAGSGTTGHAVINLNREDDGRRKYVLVEMGEYFDTVMKPRVLKAAYSSEWKAGKPVGRDGVSQVIKVLRLESYEDTLNNLRLKRPQLQAELLDADAGLREDYLLHYWVDVETRGSDSLLDVQRFDDPWGYTLEVGRGSVAETRPVTVDLVETFNYLIGLRVQQVDRARGVLRVRGLLPNGDKALVIWRNVAEVPSEKLDDHLRRLWINPRDTDFDVIFVNGDNHLANSRRPDETWKVRLIEEEFHRLMFEASERGA